MTVSLAWRNFFSAPSSGVSLELKPRRVPAVVRLLAPMLLVMTMTAFLKSTVRPWESVIRPSSRIWRRMFHTSSWAFSISSKRTTE